MATTYYIDSRIKGNISRFINHSCNPNANVYKVLVGNAWRLGIFAKKDILYCEEITIDYNLQNDKIKCFCGS